MRFIVMLMLLSLCSCYNTSAVRSVTPQEVMGLLRNDFAILVDVRESEELKDGMAQGAIWMPTSKIESDENAWREFVSKLSKAKEIIFYCAAGVRAEKVAKKLASLGFKTANMGGFSDWVKTGLPIHYQMTSF
ncbi:MAG: rhodanese-like domain-containing protein [Bdellovibrio sp.]|nr:rhodanese-like domain-containing protein [Bdellovibrio sp.]